MTYLIAQMWVLLALSTGLGVLFGLTSGVLAARRQVREVRARLASAEAATARSQEETARAAAGLQAAVAQGASSAAASSAPEVEAQVASAARIAALEAQLSEAEAARDRAQTTAEAASARIAELEAVADHNAQERVLAQADAAEPVVSVTPPVIDAEELANLQAELTQWREKAQKLEQAFVADQNADAQSAEFERMRWRNQYLSSRVDHLENQAREAEDAAPGGAPDGAAERLRARVAELEAAAGADQSEDVARLRARVAELEAGPAAPARGGAAAQDSVAWRNRYLASRVEYLERRLADTPAAGGDAPVDAGELAALRAQVAGLQAQAEEAKRLRARVNELEAGDRSDAGDPKLQWRNRYLNSRVKYLEDQLASLRDVDAPDE